ncbi:MAG: hypothetical protein PVI21_04065 [Candidatus Woesebacteria bacterium]|jgi:hypothetical protein
MSIKNSKPVIFIKKHKGLTFLGVFVIFIILTFTVGIQIPKNMTDGTEGLTGDALAVAKGKLEDADEFSHGIDWISTMHFRIRVEDVHATLPSEASGSCNTKPDPDIENHYSMKISYYSFFGVKTGEWEALNCPIWMSKTHPE